jgi:hypothetical protein
MKPKNIRPSESCAIPAKADLEALQQEMLRFAEKKRAFIILLSNRCSP